ncbi:hypothetical protein [Aeoliella mucimassa]|uniref:Uncharacterized protein n=1 Tax=Aeoliella mucimassa TaxID=2527972 RepID=A0A518ASJ6_9BACT|nr:hypothetical protein [Aeoliella mucimassa]QDU57676.1 hypothetical protein Pan181_38960 [Aeoliella mucimassa]
MALFFGSHSHKQDLGKFRESRRIGVQHDDQVTHDGYRFELMSMKSNSPINAIRYHVSIYGPQKLRVGYLRDFPSASQAISAAKRWVADRQLTEKK